MFERQDWTLFRHLDGLVQQAGVARHLIPQVVVKELVDNALDEVGTCQLEDRGPGSFAVSDGGPGLPGGDNPETVARLFSICRPLASSKLLRKPRRGALGNGLRVVAGAVLATGGDLVVTTQGKRVHLRPQDDGQTGVERVEFDPRPGTRVEVRLGKPYAEVEPRREGWFAWADRALTLSGRGTTYERESSPHWYDPAAFFELLQAAGPIAVRKLVEQLDGCSGPRAVQIAEPFRNRLAPELTREEAELLLARAREGTRQVAPAKLGKVGEIAEYGAHACIPLEVRLGEEEAPLRPVLPVVVEAWVAPASRGSESEAFASVNRTPTIGDLQTRHAQGFLSIFGCGLTHKFKVGRAPVRVHLNVQSPFVPIISNGKLPDLSLFLFPISEAIERAARGMQRGARAAGSSAPTLRGVVVESLEEAMAKVSGGGRHRFSLRQLFYGVRPFVLKAGLGEPSYSSFGAIVGDYEREQGCDLRGMYRDARGSLYHPHLGREIALGTLAVETYERPPWTFNKILFNEKEGFNQALRDSRWPERNDCALVSSKGFASRALRDLLDLMGEGDEPIECFAIHDADAAGTCIYQSLVQETAARGARKVVVHNLGLEPAEALSRKLLPEPVEAKPGHPRPVADYVPPYWKKWLQTHRIELNAMTTPEFVEWLDEKMGEFQSVKVIPPTPVLQQVLRDSTRQHVRQDLTAQILADAHLDERIEAAIDQGLLDRSTAGLPKEVEEELRFRPEEPWRAPVERASVRLAELMVEKVREGENPVDPKVH